MWQYSIKLLKENNLVSEKIYNYLKKRTNKYNSVIVLAVDDKYQSVSLAIDERYVEFAQETIARIVTKIICSFYKEKFLDCNLNLPYQDNVKAYAFKNALLNFDKDTDYFIISKNLILEGELYLDSFYNFRLQRLKEKWKELVLLANENKDYLVCKDAFCDLLKFLIDNIDISKNEIKVIEEDGGYRIIPDNEIQIEDFEETFVSEEKLVSSVIEISPRRIELYYNQNNDTVQLLKAVYEKRVCSHAELEKNNYQIFKK